MSNKAKSTSFIVTGVTALIIAFCLIILPVGSTEDKERYGGDAYTGIQQATAQTANNLVYLTQIVKIGFISVLGVSGSVLVTVGLSYREPDAVVETKKDELPEL